MEMHCVTELARTWSHLSRPSSSARTARGPDGPIRRAQGMDLHCERGQSWERAGEHVTSSLPSGRYSALSLRTSVALTSESH